MKFLNNIGLIAILILVLSACVEKTPDYGNFPSKDVDFTYVVDGNEYLTDFYVVSTIKFANTSSKSGTVSWDFGDGQTSTENNPTHKYEKAGIYKVKLTLDGVGSCTYPILIYDIAPVLTVAKQSEDIVVINDVTVEMNIFLPNPDNLKCKYIWTFPEGTMNKNGEAVNSFIGYSHEDGSIDYPGELKFKNVGSQKIQIQTWFDIDGENRRLEDSYANVQVGFNVPCKTLYCAVMGGNIIAYKIPDPSFIPKGTKILPFDMGVGSGSVPQQLIFKNLKTKDESGKDVERGWLYTLDCGKQFTYVNDENNVLGDGKISVMGADGSDANIVITNVGGQAFNDPYQGCADDEYIYYTDRNTGIRQVKLTARGEVEKTNFNSELGYMVINNQLAYYGQGLSYGAVHAGLCLDSRGVFWWGKSFNGNGLYRFKRSDINQLAKLPYPILLSGATPKCLTIDEARKKLYVWMSKGTGLGLSIYNLPEDTQSLDASAYIKNFPMSANIEQSNAGEEGLYVTQMALDKSTGNLYFGFRAEDGEKNYTTGIKYYDAASNSIKNLFDSKEKVLGIAINEKETKLF